MGSAHRREALIGGQSPPYFPSCVDLFSYQRPPKQTSIFEHPEDRIHPGALSLLAEEFKAAPAHGHGQVILTTHSPQFLDHFDVEQIRVVELADWKPESAPSLPSKRKPFATNYSSPGNFSRLILRECNWRQPAHEATRLIRGRGRRSRRSTDSCKTATYCVRLGGGFSFRNSSKFEICRRRIDSKGEYAFQS